MSNENNQKANCYPYGWRWMRLRGYLKEWLTPHEYDIAKDCLESALLATPGIAAEAPDSQRLSEEQSDEKIKSCARQVNWWFVEQQYLPTASMIERKIVEVFSAAIKEK